MDKPRVKIIKKNPRREIPVVGSEKEVEQEIKKYRVEINEEVSYIKSNAIKKKYSLTDGELVYCQGNNGYYQFPNYQFLNFPPETGATYDVGSVIRVGYISYCTHEYIEICILNYVEPVDSISMTVDPSRLLNLLSSRLEGLDVNNPLLRMLVDGNKLPKKIQGNPKTGFESAREQVEEGFITMIWGPPGTGKTYTLANLALDYMKRGKRVLIMSQSNISVDGAILKIIDITEKDGSKKDVIGKVLRYGMAREPNLYKNRDFCSSLYALNRNPIIKDALLELKNDSRLLKHIYKRNEIERSLLSVIEDLDLLEDEMSSEDKNTIDRFYEKLTNNDCSFDYLKNAVRKTRAICSKILSLYEDQYINSALIVATTATKSTISDKIRESKWDIVFFDEVSMAFVPQIMVASTLARERLVLLGDFRQLAPIVQFAPNSILRRDIFSYLNATDGKGGAINHPWLVMLNEQRRMHPEIAEYVSHNLYDGRLKTGEGVLDGVQRITKNGPFEDKSFALVDHSDFQALCYTTKSGSRFNPLSAIISVKLALKAIEKMNISIGIITPYQAQARLLSAIVNDLKKKKKLDILCSTVHQFQGFEKDLIIFDTVESEPKRETGIIFVDGEYVDDATRLVNVAITRSRGKFLVVSNYNYLNKRKEEFSKEMWKMLEYSKSKYWFHGDELLDFISIPTINNVVACYKSEVDALPYFKEAIKQGNKEKKLSYWHSSRNNVVPTSNFSGKELLQLFKEVQNKWMSVTAYNGKGIEKPILSKNVFQFFNPIDDYFVAEDSFIWFGIPKAKNGNYGRRIRYSITGSDSVAVFEMLCGHEMARKELEEKKSNTKMINSEFSLFLSKRIDSDCCKKGACVKKTHKGKYIVVCKKCGKTLIPYVPRDVITDYIKEKEYRCKTCGSLLKVGKYNSLYCPIDYNHKVSITVEDIYQ